ncbi:MAG: hypothetical protein AAB541_01795 [Patescibacteria group bacterium]
MSSQGAAERALQQTPEERGEIVPLLELAKPPEVERAATSFEELGLHSLAAFMRSSRPPSIGEASKEK